LLARLAEEYGDAERGVAAPWCPDLAPHTGRRVCGAFCFREETTVTEPEEPTAVEPEGEAVGPVAPPTRRRAPGADPAVRSFGQARTCAAEDCQTRLSRYNPDSFCSVHRGWDRQVVTRRRRADDDA
jgi:hypothetical protein